MGLGLLTICLYFDKKGSKIGPVQTNIKSLLILPALMAGLSLVWATQVAAQTYKILHNFNEETFDGVEPQDSLVLSGNTLYGTASGGDSTGGGTIFKVNTDGTGYATLYTFTAPTPFTNSDGACPDGGLVLSGSTLYGTAPIGGSAGNGTVFAISTNGTGFTVLHSFPNGPNNSEGLDGIQPHAGLVFSGGILYGTAMAGGIWGAGTVFALGTNGDGFTVLHNFDGSDGQWPMAGLIISGNTLYGAAGSVFEINTDGSGFASTQGGGAGPGGLAFSGNTLYGTEDGGGSLGHGAVFAVGANGADFTILYNFTGGADGSGPLGGLLLLSNTLYGTTQAGGDFGYGAIFAVNTNGTDFTTLYSFTGSDGATPYAGLIFSGTTFYGTTFEGGSTYSGTVFALSALFVQITANPTVGAAPLTVNFSSPSVDNFGNAIASWYWTFGDGSSSSAQNPSHTYTVPGNFSPVLMATNNNEVQITALAGR
jgi:uncharacterized repeat protein (TIGR03803 family)